MSHNLWQVEGKAAMFCVGDCEAAWHKLGQRTDTAVNWSEAIKLAGLDWKVIKKDLFARNPLDNSVFQLPDTQGMFRVTDGAYLGCVGDGYQIIQNRDAFDFVDSILEAQDGSHYESAGALGKGERIWCMARISNDFEVLPGDKHETYLLFTTSHDGSLAATCKVVATRVVCQNTLSVALKEGGAMMRVKHTADAKRKLEAAKQMMSGVTATVKSISDKLATLASRKVTRESLTSIIDRLFPKSKEAQSDTRRDNIVADVMRCFESNDRNAIPEARGTAYNLLNAITEYTDHFRSSRVTDGRPGYTQDKARSDSALMGSGDKLKSQALEVILETTSGDPVVSRIMTTAPVAPKPSGSILDSILDSMPV